MNRLVRAEFYRIWHSGFFTRILILLFFVVLFFPVMTDFEFFSKTLAEVMDDLVMGVLISTMFLSVITSFFVSLGYMKKTAYYEVMAGSKNGHIIGSKLVTEGIFLGVLFFIAIIGFGVVTTIKNGTGGVENLGTRCLMLIFVCLRMTVVGTLMGMAIKNYAACLVAYARFLGIDMMLSSFLLPLLYMKEILGETVYQRLQHCMTNTQIGTICGSAAVTTEAVVWCLVSFFVEAIAWYILVYVTMKKKWYK